jgi:anaerobic magnesium-protoporphyrin IX monomethyl ester cyclase
MSSNRIKIVLVNAPPLGILEPWYDLPDFPRGALANLAAYLRVNGFQNILCVDAKLERLSFQETLNKIISYQPSIVGFTAFTNEIKPCAYLAAKLKQEAPQILTIVGGAHSSAIPIPTLREFPGFDVVVSGDGEETLLEIAERKKNDLPIDDVLGISFRFGDQLLKNPERPRILNQDDLPMPAWDLLPKAKHYWLQTSKGCPFKCVFCMNHNGRVVRKIGIEKTIQEIKFVLDNYEPEWIRFGDEIFTADRSRTVEFLNAWIANGFHKRVKWDLQTHVRYVDRELLALFKKANVTQFDMGVESGDNNVLKSMGKATNEAMIVNAFKLAHEEGLKTGSLLLLGQPDETIASMINTIKLAVKINATLPMIGVMMPLPGTEVAKLASKGESGYKAISYDWDEYRKNVGVALEFSNFSRKQIELVQFWGFVLIYILNFRFFDLIGFLFKYRVEGWNNFKKLIFGSMDSKKLFTLMPTDYYYILSNGTPCLPEDMNKSKKDFDIIQQEEMRRTNTVWPELIKEQMPMKTKSIHQL